MDQVRTAVAKYVAAHDLMPDGATVVVGASGGLDSTVAAHVLYTLGYGVHLTHVNFGLRGLASDADEEAVRALADLLGVPVHVQQVTDVSPGQPNLQVQARDIRLAYFSEVARYCKSNTIVTGHHRDDQAETILLSLFRGTGLSGLAGMAPVSPLPGTPDCWLVRPLLGLARADLLAYAAAAGLSWRDDATNATGAYTRNRLRHNVLPAADLAMGHDVAAHLAHTANLVRNYLVTEHDPLVEALLAPMADAKALSVAMLRSLPQVWQQRVVLAALERWLPGVPRTQAVLLDIAGLASKHTGKRWTHPAGRVVRDAHALMFQQALPQGIAPCVQQAGRIETPLGMLVIGEDEGGGYEERIDGDQLTAPLEVRLWQAGDRFVPLGSRSLKKVSTFLTDQHVPHSQRDRVLVVTHGEEIVWVVGLRLDARYRVCASTKNVLRLRFCPADAAPSG